MFSDDLDSESFASRKGRVSHFLTVVVAVEVGMEVEKIQNYIVAICLCNAFTLSAIAGVNPPHLDASHFRLHLLNILWSEKCKVECQWYVKPIYIYSSVL